ncbi:hypothetical protein AVEN_77536-1 [Araneus ventricosus]|uniref:Uncharacterized protein n=1 Tax=Araneus ventricosus TaxID=182803 RepID=A0A4Y2QUJ2_ARAVE|nr:hypothetical protein AVEN_77536-1 [Araneus ventricosus]
MAEEIDNVFENDQMGHPKTDRHESVCVCKERIVCKSRAFSNRSTKIGVCASSLSVCILHDQSENRISNLPQFHVLRHALIDKDLGS